MEVSGSSISQGVQVWGMLIEMLLHHSRLPVSHTLLKDSEFISQQEAALTVKRGQK